MTWQAASILFPDIDLWGTGYIRTALAARAEPYADDVFVSNTTPDPRRDRMVIVRRAGGVASGVLDKPRISVNVWATTEQDVNDLSRLVVALFLAARTTPVTHVAQVGGLVTVPDPSGQPRRLVTFEITTRGVPA